MSVHETVVQVLAQDPGGQGEDFGKSSPVGLLLLVLFGIAVALLVRSMTKHLKKLPKSFDEKKAAAAAPARTKSAESAESAESSESTESVGSAESADDVESTRGAAGTDPASGDDADGSRSSAAGDSAPVSEGSKD